MLLNIFSFRKYIAEEIIPRRRELTEKNNFKETIAWRVPKSKHYPEGIKYSFVLIHENKRVLGIDNYNNEGHHTHYFDRKERYNFTNIEEAKKDFNKMIEKFEEGGEND